MKKLLILICFIFLLNSCGVSFKYATLNHVATDPLYGDILPVPSTTKVDTINSMFDLKSELRNDFSFRWDFAQYAINQPYSWYWNNPRLNGIWRPYNRFDVYFNSHWFMENQNNIKTNDYYRDLYIDYYQKILGGRHHNPATFCSKIQKHLYNITKSNKE